MIQTLFSRRPCQRPRCALLLRALLLSALVTLACGCTQPERLGGEPPIDPRRSNAPARFEPVTLEVESLRTHADYDAWEDAIITRRSAQMAYALYRETLSRKRGNQRTFVRWMLLSYDEEIPEQLRERLRPFVDALAQNPDNLGPDVRYLLGLMAWKRLTGGANRPDIPVDFRNASLVDTVTQNWNELLRVEPEWVGPRGISAADLKQRLAALEVSRSGKSAPSPEPARDATGVGQAVASRVDAAWRAAGEPPHAEARAKDFYEAIEPFAVRYEDRGSKPACEQVDKALRVLYHPTLLGDAVAHCALDRRNPFEAVDQVRRMLSSHHPGGLEAVLTRLTSAAKDNQALATEVTALVAQSRQVAEAAPEYARRTGLDRWLARHPAR